MTSEGIIKWLLNAGEPWTRYRVLLDLLDRSLSDPDVVNARAAMLAHPQVRALINAAAEFSKTAITRHNDAKHPLYKLSTLADFGIRVDDAGMKEIIQNIISQQTPEGALQSQVEVPEVFGGKAGAQWAWMICDAPTLLYILLTMGLTDELCLQRATNHLIHLVNDNGWRCRVTPELGKFRGPGRKEDPCPIANVYALKALSMTPAYHDHPAVHLGSEVLMSHWEHQKEVKMYLFGMGTDFHKLKYPFIWYDLLHVVEVLSRFTFTHNDPRFQQMLEAITQQADTEGKYTAGSMYQAWKEWSFANKKIPSPWLTLMILRIQKRVTGKI